MTIATWNFRKHVHLTWLRKGGKRNVLDISLVASTYPKNMGHSKKDESCLKPPIRDSRCVTKKAFRLSITIHSADAKRQVWKQFHGSKQQVPVAPSPGPVDSIGPKSPDLEKTASMANHGNTSWRLTVFSHFVILHKKDSKWGATAAWAFQHSDLRWKQVARSRHRAECWQIVINMV